jgi:hypothetical protein
MSSPLLPEIDLPDDFARRVIGQARREQQKRRHRLRIAAAALLAVGLIPLSRLADSRRHNFGGGDSSALAWQQDSAEATQLAAAAEPDEVSDYLTPEATRVTSFTAAYSDAGWRDDSDWTGSE